MSPASHGPRLTSTPPLPLFLPRSNQIVQGCGITLPSAPGTPGTTFSFARSLVETPFSLAEGTEPEEAAGALLNTLDAAKAQLQAFAAPKLA